MKRWVVERWVNGNIADCWGFDNKAESLKFFNKKANNLNKERIEENRKSIFKLKNDDERGYYWVDTEYGTQRLNAFKTWRGVKEERWKDED